MAFNQTDRVIGRRRSTPGSLPPDRVSPDNQHVILVTRGDNAPTDDPVDPGSIETFGFKDDPGGSSCRIGGDGKLAFVRKYEIEATTQKQQFSAGMVALA